MSSSDISISVRGLSKSYKIRHKIEHHTMIADALLSRMRRPLQRMKPEEFWALRDVTLDVRQGEVLGIIGRNGAGKSTLLKVLSRITTPTRGEVHMYGRVGSLLEVGTGFHPELTGRENIFLNGAVLGMRRREIERRFDEIVDFAGVERFLDTPVKRYSSGMSVRLAFSVAAHLDTDVLLIDEVLAVGDQDFQRKCLDRMRDVASAGRTVVFVSHNLQAIRQLCGRAVCIGNGNLTEDGDCEGVLARYAAASFDTVLHSNDRELAQRPGSGELRVVAANRCDMPSGSGHGHSIRYQIDLLRPFEGKYWISAHVCDAQGTILVQCDSRLDGHWIETRPHYCGRLDLRHPWLRPGRYTVNLYLCASGIIDACEPAASFEVPPDLPYSHLAGADATAHGMVFADFSYSDVIPSDQIDRSNALLHELTAKRQ